MRDARDIPAAVTRRQGQVLALIAAGCSNEEIAERLGISPRTVKAHSDALRVKFGVRRRREIPHAYLVRMGSDPFSGALQPTLAAAGV
jgi:DNA-binding CsgD family transcriptional regulator